MGYQISPIGNDQFFDSNGNLLVGGKIFTYLAATSTKVATYTDILGSASHTNPIILNASGMPPVPIYLIEDLAYKFVLASANDTDPPSSPIYTWDNILVHGIDQIALPEQWIEGTVPTYVSATSFSIVGDQTATYQVGRRVKLHSTIETFYGWITASAYTSVTTVTVVLDSGSLDATLDLLWYSVLTGQNTAIPNMRHSLNNTTLAQNLTVLGNTTLTETMSFNLVPVGALLPYAGSTAPSAAFKLCDGAAVSRTTYAVLFALVSTAYGVGDGSTTFNLPDLRGRAIIMVDGAAARITSASTNGANADTLGGAGGAETHTLTTAELAVHSHTVPQTDDATGHVTGSGPVAAHNGGVNNSVTSNNAGSGNAHSNTQPWLAMNYIIRMY